MRFQRNILRVSHSVPTPLHVIRRPGVLVTKEKKARGPVPLYPPGKGLFGSEGDDGTGLSGRLDPLIAMLSEPEVRNGHLSHVAIHTKLLTGHAR